MSNNEVQQCKTTFTLHQHKRIKFTVLFKHIVHIVVLSIFALGPNLQNFFIM